MALLGVVLYLCAWIAHGWLTFSHRYRMGSDPGDSRRDPTVRTRQIEWGLQALWWGQALAGIGLILSLFPRSSLSSGVVQFFWDLALTQLWPGEAGMGVTVSVGALLALSGVTIRLWAIRALGRLFTFEIGIRAEHRIINEGPYRWLRHPSYTGYLLLLIGMALLGRSLGLWFGTVLPAVFFLVRRIRDEEAMLLRHFGQAYRDYSARTWRLIPGLF